MSETKGFRLSATLGAGGRWGGFDRKRHRINDIWILNLIFQDQEVDGSNPFAPTIFKRSFPNLAVGRQGSVFKLSLSFSPFRPFAPLLGRFRANATHPTKKP